MRFLVDAQLPRRLCEWLGSAGHDAVHTLDLPLGNRTPDGQILEIAAREDRIVVTKDDDFVQSHLISGRPERLLLIATGNIGNSELDVLMHKHLASIVAALEGARFVEVGQGALTVHG